MAKSTSPRSVGGRRRLFAWLVALLTGLLFAFAIHHEAVPMSFLNPTRTCVFSAVKARLTMNGEPIERATVVRRWEWQKLREDTTQTDDDGAFSFPAVFESSITRLLPIELVIAQNLSVKIGGEDKVFWINSKREPEENAEYRDRPISLACEMTRENKIDHQGNSTNLSVCDWVAEP